MSDKDRVIPIEKFGQHYHTNHFNCGGCGKVVDFDKWTTACSAERQIVNAGWFNSNELGWVCHDCLFKYFEYIAETIPWYRINFNS